MNFQDAEYQYRILEQKWFSGQLSVPVYRDRLARLQVVDNAGELWMLQEHTGQWFVYRGGQWVGGLRAPVQTIQPPSQPLPNQNKPSISQQSYYHTTPQHYPASSTSDQKVSKKKNKMLLIVLLAGVFLCCGGLVLGGGYAVASGLISIPPQLSDLISNNQKINQDTSTSQPQVQIKSLENLSVSADGTPYTDSRGVSLIVPAEALEEGGLVKLTSSELNSSWIEEIDSVVTIDSPFYSLSVPGKNDSTGSLSLSFPAENPQSRLLAVIDDEYLVEFAQSPQDGKLTVMTRAAPTDTTEMMIPEGYDGTGTIYYAVITPKTTSQITSDIQMVSLSSQVDERNCIPDLSIIGGAAINLCRQNAAGTVQVMLPTLKRELLPQVDLLVDKIETVMNKYYDLGFTTAQLSKNSPMLVRVSTKVTSPSYYPLNGILYIPVDSVAKIATLSPTDVYHEMAHWIQAVKYSTRLAYWSGEKTWWLETAAENMVMLVEPDYVGSNLTTYGTITNDNNSLVFQSEPYQWPGDYYVHAQLVKVNMCESPSCPLSTASFARAISEGKYLLMDGAKKSMISGNLKDYAYYLLGKSPVSANSAISLNGPVSSGEGYGEYVRVTRTTDTDIKYDYNGADPQMKKDTVDGKDALVIQANLQRDGVYPLVIQGGQGNNPGLPVEMVIEPGAPFYYTLDNGELMYSDGSQELKIQPIHGQMGIKKVRLVAIGENAGQVFNARIQPLDLEGAWVIMISGAKTGGGMTCSGGSGETENPDGTGQFMGLVLSMMSGMGDMQTDPTGRNLDWFEVSSRVPAEFTEGGLTYTATALLSGDMIKYQAKVNIPSATEQSSLPPMVPLVSTAVILPATWLERKHLKNRHLHIFTNMLVIAFLVLVSTGCFGMGMYGSAMLDARFQKIEYVGKEDTGVLSISNDIGGKISGVPIWKLTGTGTYDVTFYIETSVSDFNGNETTEITTCVGQITYPVIGYVFKDYMLQLPAD